MLRFSFIQPFMRLYSENVVISILFYLNSSIRLWALSGEVLLEMVGHTSIVYSVDAHASGLIVSGSEDRHAKIWKGDHGFPFVYIDASSVLHYVL